MKTNLWAVLLAGSVSLTSLALAEDPAPPSASTTPAPAANAIQAELAPLIDRIKAKLNKGENTQEALAVELKQFDALLEKHKAEKTEDVSQVLLMKALLYVQVFNDFDQGEKLFRQLQSDFPDTQAGKKVAEIMPMLLEQKAAAQTRSALKVGATFPDFQETDVAGQPLSLAKYKGKVVLVDFWATWCGPCVAELPNVIAAYQKYHDKGFEIVGVSLDEKKDDLEKFTKEKGMTWQQYFDGKGWQSKLGKKYGITAIPATFLLDRDGKIIATDLRGPALEAELAKQLAGK